VSGAALTDRVAIVFGSATGIGAACARTLAERGAAVILADIAVEAAERTAAQIAASGGQAVVTRCDVTAEADVAAAVALAETRFGRLDIVHNNAAAMQLVAKDRPVADEDAGHWDLTMAVNLRGQMFGCKHAVPAMIRCGGGSIINTSSASALAGELNQTAYGVSKAGVAQLTRAVATQYGRKGVRCNAVLPGLVQVERQRTANTASAEFRESLARNHLTPYVGEPQDIANVVAFLASDESRFVTGHLFSVDGGLTVHQGTYADLVDPVGLAVASTFQFILGSPGRAGLGETLTCSFALPGTVPEHISSE
jgi:NAD(P)-dependent dehydrogenase (short-subunit alcohol dehydrogenase family)